MSSLLYNVKVNSNVSSKSGYEEDDVTLELRRDKDDHGVLLLKSGSKLKRTISLHQKKLTILGGKLNGYSFNCFQVKGIVAITPKFKESSVDPLRKDLMKIQCNDTAFLMSLEVFSGKLAKEATIPNHLPLNGVDTILSPTAFTDLGLVRKDKEWKEDHTPNSHPSVFSRALPVTNASTASSSTTANNSSPATSSHVLDNMKAHQKSTIWPDKNKKKSLENIFKPVQSASYYSHRRDDPPSSPFGTSSRDQENSGGTRKTFIGINQFQSRFNSLNDDKRSHPYKQTQIVRDPEGFRNMGQTCYIAVVLQLLYHSKCFRDSLLSSRDFVKNWLGGETVFESFADVFDKKDKKEIANLQQVQSKVASLTSGKNNRFGRNIQEDAHEFLIACMDHLTVSEIIIDPEMVSSSPSKEAIAKRDPVLNTIQFSINHICECVSPDCDYESKHAETFRDISLFLPPAVVQTEGVQPPILLVDLLKSFFQAEKVEYKCSKCDCNEAVLYHTIHTLPKMMLLHVKRFDFGFTGVGGKRGDPIDIPLSFDLKDICLEMKTELEGVDSIYGLTGIISHLGETIRNGHYIYSSRDISTQVWTEYNDSVVSRNLKGIEKKRREHAYILVYQLIHDVITVLD